MIDDRTEATPLDYCRVTIVGNLRSDIRHTRSADDPQQGIGVTSVCIARTLLIQGSPVQVTTTIPVEIIGAARAARAAQCFSAGSRIVIDGHLEERSHSADGIDHRYEEPGTATPRTWLVLVVDAIFNADLPSPARGK